MTAEDTEPESLSRSTVQGWRSQEEEEEEKESRDQIIVWGGRGGRGGHCGCRGAEKEIKEPECGHRSAVLCVQACLTFMRADFLPDKER